MEGTTRVCLFELMFKICNAFITKCLKLFQEVVKLFYHTKKPTVLQTEKLHCKKKQILCLPSVLLFENKWTQTLLYEIEGIRWCPQ